MRELNQEGACVREREPDERAQIPQAMFRSERFDAIAT